MIDGQRAPCDEGFLQAPSRARAESACSERDRPWVLATAVLGSSLAFLTGSVVNVALPAIQRDLGADAGQVQWVLNAYLLPLGALLLPGGAAGDRFGRRRVFVLGVLVFAAASLAAGLAPSPALLITARAVQGLGGALLVPGSLALISTFFPPEERGRAIGTWAGFSALTTAFGPALGGFLVDTLSWRWAFHMMVPFALAASALALWRVPESRAPREERRETGSVDWPGALLITAGLGAVTYALVASAEEGWAAAPVLAALIAGLLLLALFLWVETRRADPMLPLGLFRDRAFAGANLMTLLLYFALTAALYFLPFNLIRVQGYSAAAAGAAFLPFTLVMAVLSRWAGGLIGRFGARLPLVVGPAVAAVGLGLLALPGIGGSYWTTFFPALLVLGLGMAVSVAPLTTVVMGSVPDEQTGTASGINNAASRIAGLLSVAVLGSVALSLFIGDVAARLDVLGVSPDIRQAMLGAARDLAGAEVPEGLGDRQTLTALLDRAFVATFRVVAWIAAAMAALSALVAAATIPRRVS